MKDLGTYPDLEREVIVGDYYLTYYIKNTQKILILGLITSRNIECPEICDVFYGIGYPTCEFFNGDNDLLRVTEHDRLFELTDAELVNQVVMESI